MDKLVVRSKGLSVMVLWVLQPDRAQTGQKNARLAIPGLFLDLEESHFRPILLGRVKVPGVARQEHRGSGVIVCHARLVRG